MCFLLDDFLDADSSICPICQDTIVHPITLPCSHTFCYLCLKGVFARRGTCALCRQPIPTELVSKPKYQSSANKGSVADDSVQWLYQAKDGGWWMYEQRLINEIETAYKTGQKHKLDVQISGFMYVIDLRQMVQYRAEKPNRQRRIKRQVTTTTSGDNEYKGIAGILIEKDE